MAENKTKPNGDRHRGDRHSGDKQSGDNIVLTGFMGTGKSTVGRLVADKLGFDFVDTDVVIESRFGSIKEIFATQGETAFRHIEREIAAELAKSQRSVIATGGRMMLDPANQSTLGTSGHVFCLSAPSDEILSRILDDPSSIERPLLQVADPRTAIAELLEERLPLYARYDQVQTSGRTPEAVCDEIITRVNETNTGTSD